LIVTSLRAGDRSAGIYTCPMCGRFTHRYTWADIHRLYRLTSPASNVQPSYNVCPTDTVNVVTSFQDTRILQPMRWGLIPRWWSKPLKDLVRLSTFNARVETVTTKPFFREAFKRTRCIIPASGYYEWQDTPNQAAALLHASRWASHLIRRAVGRMERPRDRRDVEILHDDHHRAERHGRGSP
jgi:putative SOS response-associated peptidase YedK